MMLPLIRARLAAWLFAALLLPCMPALAQVDPCAGKSLCESQGPFAVEIVQASPSSHGNNHHIRMVVRVHNTGSEPLVLGYVQDSGVMEDNLGNRYIVDSRYREHVGGIGQVTRNQADARFVLAPGASRNFTLIFQRFTGRSPQIARSYSPSFALAQLEPLSANQVRTASEYSFNFFDMGLAVSAQQIESLGRGLKELFEGRKK